MAAMFELNKKYMFSFELFKAHMEQEKIYIDEDSDWARNIDNKEIEIRGKYVGFAGNMGVVCDWCKEI